MEWDLHILPLTTVDDALAKACERLRAIGQEIVKAAETPLLPLFEREGVFDDLDPTVTISLNCGS